MAKKTIPASVSLPRDTYNRLEQLAQEATADNFSRTVSQLVEVGLMALETGWQRPSTWWPESGRQVIYHFSSATPTNGPVLEGQEALDLPKKPLPADLL